MADPEGESLESWLNKATNPSNRKEEWEYIIGFCDQMNKELEGPQISVRLLAHKIQSPQEWESLQALIVLEACMKNCGKRFHNEVGKFRFLNELIKIVSPKYLGDRVSERVKTKVIEMLYSWSVALPEEAKITEAYRMLKNKGIVTADPDIHVDRTIVSSPQPKNPVFDNEEKSKRLAELLKSKKPEDLQEANRIIKNMVKEDEARQQKVSQRVSTLEEVNNSVKLLNEMLSHFKSDESTQADKELLKDLYNDCDKLRTAVFKLATETEDDDSALGDILHASDDLSRVINSYKKIVEGQTIIVDTSGSTATKHTNDGNSSEVLIDMADLDSGASSPLKQFMPPPQDSLPADLFTLTPLVEALPSFNNSGLPGLKINKNESSNSASTSQLLSGLSLLDEELCTLGLGNLEKSMSAEKNKKEEHSNQWISAQTSKPVIDLLCSSTPLNPLISTAPRTSKATSLTGSESSLLTAESSASAFFQESCADQNKSNSYSSFVVGEGNTHTALTAFSLPTGIAPVPSPLTTGKPQSFTPDSPLFRSLSPTPSSHMPSSSGLDISLTSVYVPLEAIKPSKESPVTAYDKDGVRVLLHLATNHPPGRPDVLVIVVSMLNTAPLLVKNLVLQAAVPKSMRIKLQPPSGTEMGPFNPLLPPSSITQIMLLANPLREKVRMRYKLTFMLGDQQVTETGEMDVFPHLERWGH